MAFLPIIQMNKAEKTPIIKSNTCGKLVPAKSPASAINAVVVAVGVMFVSLIFKQKEP